MVKRTGHLHTTRVNDLKIKVTGAIKIKFTQSMLKPMAIVFLLAFIHSKAGVFAAPDFY
jgi:hypothetical protein